MATNITCPKCGHSFALGEAEVEEYKQQLREQMTVYKKQKDEAVKKMVGISKSSGALLKQQHKKR